MQQLNKTLVDIYKLQKEIESLQSTQPKCHTESMSIYECEIDLKQLLKIFKQSQKILTFSKEEKLLVEQVNNIYEEKLNETKQSEQDFKKNLNQLLFKKDEHMKLAEQLIETLPSITSSFVKYVSILKKRFSDNDLKIIINTLKESDIVFKEDARRIVFMSLINSRIQQDTLFEKLDKKDNTTITDTILQYGQRSDINPRKKELVELYIESNYTEEERRSF